ncbi:MAG: diaminopimelate epimerase [Myxococcales bacterium]|nr:diaminopimelate epimerase [Myxococcales bacterium]
MKLAFTKVEGLGNDFLLLDLREHHLPISELQARAPALCDRRTGVGGDGLLLVTTPTSPHARATMIVVNFDGSRPEMCGNGLRCVALYLADQPGDFIVDTDSGPRPCRVHTREETSGSVEVDMGLARLLGPRRVGEHDFTAVSVGNPHAVAFVDEDPERLARRYGPTVERDAQFPERTNVEFARVEHGGSLTLWVWERGCGITAACGTGACATVAAAVDRGLVPVDTPVTVQLPGGRLAVRWRDGRVFMTGPARLVYRGALL